MIKRIVFIFYPFLFPSILLHAITIVCNIAFIKLDKSEDQEIFVHTIKHMSCLVGKPTVWFPNRSDTNQAVQAPKTATGWKLWI